MTASITAIIPTYNRSAMLKECIESVLAQTRAVRQIIVVNDGSTDDTEIVARSFGERVTLICKANGGKSSALNVAMPQATSDYIWICDDDDIADPKGIEALGRVLDNDLELGFAFGDFRIFRDGADGRIFSPPNYRHRAEETNPKINFLEGMFTFQYAMLVRRSLYREAGAFREDMVRSQDYEMTLRLARKAKSAYVPQIIFYQRQHDGTRGSSQDRFPADIMQQKWLLYDQKIFISVRRDYALEEFIPSFAGAWDEKDTRRAALVERACILAKQALWEDALADLHQAVSMAATAPSAGEMKVAETIIRTTLPWIVLSQHNAWVGALRAAAHENAFGRAIVASLCHPLVWQSRNAAKDGDIALSAKLFFLLCRILGLRGTLRRVRMSLTRS